MTQTTAFRSSGHQAPAARSFADATRNRGNWHANGSFFAVTTTMKKRTYVSARRVVRLFAD